MEHQGADLDALPGIIIHVGRITEGRVGDAAGAAVELRVKALDQGDLVRLLAVQEVPLVVGVRADGQRLAPAVRVDQANGHQVRVRHRVRIRNRQRVLEDLLDRPPHVDDLVPRLQEPVRFLREMVWHARLGRTVALVNMHTVHRPAEIDRRVGVRVSLVFGRPPDRVIEDENSRCAGSGWC